jgi:eukaryotic-like serine/threonine-protein kinase
VNTALESTLSQQAAEIGPGHVLGRYELLLPIASGGMAMVWAARLKGSRGFQKIVAVKTMLPKLSEDEQFEQMFLDEASLASQIRHPHVVEILDLGEQQGILFLVMEWVDGVPLNQLMKAARPKGGVPIPVAVRIAIQACGGLQAAHELKDSEGKLVGLVHRDISPQNLLVTYDGVVKVVDFGVAKATALGGGATVAGQIKGKVAYMAPEQVKGGAIDRRVDLFAMGIVLYALTTGKHPFRRESEAATMYNICSPTPVMPPRKVIADYPAELELVILKSLSKDPARRYQTANEMLKALDQLPQTMRASTDEDVGKFVMSLFGDKRAERQTAMTEALARAEELARTRAAGPLSMGSELLQGAQSQVSYVTGTGVTANNEFSGIPATAATGAMTGFGQNSPRRKLVMGAAMVALGLLAVGLVVALRSRSATPVLTQASGSQTTATAPSVVSTAAAPGTPSASDSRVPVAAATTSEGASLASTEASVEPANKNNRPNTKPPKTTASASPGGPVSTAAPKVKQQWKQDPGF